MRLENMRPSENVEDRRGSGGGGRRGGVVVGGGLGGVVLVVLFILLGGNPQQLVQPGGSGTGGGHSHPGQSPTGTGVQAGDAQSEFVSRVLGDTEDVWTAIFKAEGKRYEPARLVLFTESVDSACGFATDATGPFYCPADHQVYIDLGFYDDLVQRFGAPGDFAQAYVIAHEVGHHVQNQLGISQRVQAMKGRVSEAEYNDLSVRLELQADFFAGVWAHHGQKQRKILDEGDLEEALRAAAAIGDDRLQKQAQGYAVPETFTHGTSEQRMRWFKKGFVTGDITQGDTFSVANP